MSQPLSAATVQESVRTQVTERRGVLARAGPAAMMALLGAAALWPVVAPVLGTGVAVGVAGGALGLLSGPGSGAVSAFLDRTLEHLRGRDEPAARDELERELLARLTAGDPGAAALRAEVSRLLEEGGAVDAALSAVPAESRDELATRLAELGAEWHEFRWMLGAVQDQLQELQARQIEALALHRTTLDLQREQLVKTNLLLRRQEPAPAPPPDKGNGAAALPPAPVASPYKGLEPFQPEDAERFFGRDGLVAALLARLAEAPFLAVVGPSGSGKSSAVRAGLVPALWAGRLPGSDGWKTVIMTPGERPLEQLAHRLALERGVAPGSVLDDLRSRPDGLRLVVEQALLDEPDGVRLVLVVDQFEELFTLSRDADERAAFVAALAAAGERAVVIVALRADFYGHAARLGRFADLLGSHQELVGPMSREELVEAIERPAEGAGLKLEPGLAEAIVDDVADEPGALPLLSHALLATFERRQGALLTHQGYVESGGVRGAIARTAESVFEQRLDPGQQALARGILLRLTQLGEGTEDTRRRVPPDTLVAAGEPAEPVEAVLRTLVDARLVTAGEGTVEVAHEALIREWPRLRGWLAENREGLEIHHRLAEDASDWEALNREPAALMRGSRLLAAKEWAERHPGDMNALEREFLEASRAAERSELEAARRRTRRLRALSLALGVLAVAAVVAAVYAVRSSQDADRERDNAKASADAAASGNLVAQSVNELDRRLDAALLMALEAYRQKPTALARDSLVRAIQRSAPQTMQMHGHTDLVGQLALSADGKRLASGSFDGTVRLWDVATGRQLGDPLPEPGPAVPVVALSRDGGMLAVAANGKITLWDADHRRTPLRTWRTKSQFMADGAMSGDGDTLAFMSGGGSLYAIDVPSRRLVERVHSNPAFAPFRGMALSRDGRYLATTGGITGVALWRVRTTGPRRGFDARPLDVPSSLGFDDAVAFDAAGRTLAAVPGNGGKLHRWIVATGRHLEPVRGTPRGKEGTTGAVDPDAGAVVVARETGALAVRLGTLRSFRLAAPLTAVKLMPDAKRIVAGTERGTIEVLDITASLPLAHRIPGLEGEAVALDASGNVLAAGQRDGSIRLWDLERSEPIGDALRLKPGASVKALTFPPGGGQLVAVYRDRKGRVSSRDWSLASPERSPPKTTLPDRGRRFRLGQFDAAALSRDGSTLVWLRGTSVRIWSIRDGSAREYRPGITEPGPLSFLDSTGVAIAPDSGTLAVWDADSVEIAPLDRLDEHVTIPATGVIDVALSPDGDTMATLQQNSGAVQLWSLRTRDRLGDELSGNEASALRFSPDGSQLLSFGATTMHVWDVRSRQPIGDGFAGVGELEDSQDVAFAGRPLRLVTSGYSGPGFPVYLLDPLLVATDVGAFERRVCAIANRNLRLTEVQDFPEGEQPVRCVP